MGRRLAVLALIAALVLGACSGDEEAPGPPATTATPKPTSTPTPSPTDTAEPTPEPSPTRTATPGPASTPTPVAAFSLEVTAETTWQEAFDALIPRERDCIREAVDQDSLAGLLQLTVVGDDGPFEESVSAFVACLDPDTARYLLLSTLLVGMEGEGIAPSERERACLEDWLSGVDVAELVSADDEESDLETFAAMMRCVPHVMVLGLFGPLDEGVEFDEEARGCLREWGADTDWPLVMASGGDAIGATFLAGLAGCTPDLVLAIFLSESGVGLEDLSDEQLACLREWIAEVDWEGLIDEGGEGMDALLAAAGLVQCAPGLLQPESDTGQAPTSLLQPDESLLWHYPAGGWVVRPPAVHGGVVFFGSDGRVHAVDAASGAPLWRFEAADGVGMMPIATEDAVYVGSKNSHVYALDRDTGELLWQLDTGESADSYPTPPSLTVSGGVVYAAVLSDEQREIRALDGASGEVLWIAASPHVEAAPAVIGGRVYGPSGRYDDEFRGLDASSGEPLWSLEARRGSRELLPTVSGGVVYLTAFDTAYALDEETGQTIWSYATDGSPSNSPAVVEDGVYYFTPQERLHALDASTGAVLWSYIADDIIISGPVVAGGVVCLGSWSGQVHAVDAATGEGLWVEPNEEWVLTLIVADGVLYFESGGTVRALDAATGEEVWRFYKGGGSLIGSTFTVADGVVYVGSIEGGDGAGVYAFEAPAGTGRER